MNLCSTCEKIFDWETLKWHGDQQKFCSTACLPEGVLDEPFALQYVGLVQSFWDIENQPPSTSYYNQQELLEEVDALITQTEEYVLGDTEGLFYKEELSDLHNKFCNLRDVIESYFKKKENFQVDYGLYIGWEFIRTELSNKVAIDLQQSLQQLVNDSAEKPMISYNQELDALIESQNILYYDDGDGSFIDHGIHPLIEQLHGVGKAFLEQLTNDDLEMMLSFVELARCPKCGIMEPWEDFDFKDYYNLLACWSC